ncbi:MAG TPA: Asp-tRNA(Asn)/Glu-tRNA(Gln) amidotransferase subunit GatB [Candidatus Babeliales bacterium]|nr:Asp-tRNA(Asn)/Glu-tRNA(Gln) amidotransferase subunit GatB [Candidatus Babeliales bacterium]
MSKQDSVLSRYPDYTINIGIEVHTQLTTKSKIFCSCPNEVTIEPNKNICNVCAGHPGVMPVLNKQVVDYAIAAGLATNCTINPISTFARKHYFYPDLPKGYQITQSDKPICLEGYVPIRLEDGTVKNIRLIRIHIEEDAGKNIHSPYGNESFVNLNRAGTPLLETVTYPDIESTDEAKAYLRALRLIVQQLGICSGNMEEGAFRADTNISVRKKDAKELGTRVELKNINSFKFIGDAIEYEIERQINVLQAGGKVYQETRLWDSKNKKSIVMRGKEEAADYRYFQDPDLPRLEVNPDWISSIQVTLPELPYEKFERFIKENGLSAYEAEIIVDDLELANYFEAVCAVTKSKNSINWILRDLMGYIKESKISLSECKVTPAYLGCIVDLLDAGKINNHTAKDIFAMVAETGKDPVVIIKEQGLEQIGSTEELEVIIKEIIAANPESVAEYKSGKDKLFGFFVGQAMKKTAGKGSPAVIQDLLKKHLQ